MPQEFEMLGDSKKVAGNASSCSVRDKSNCSIKLQSHFIFSRTVQSYELVLHVSNLRLGLGLESVFCVVITDYNFFLSIRMTQMTTFMGGTLCVIFVVVF